MTILFEAIFDAIMSPLILKQFIHKILDDRSESLIIVFAISVNIDTFMLEGGLIAIERYFFDILGEVGEVVIAIDLKELYNLFLFER